MNKKILIIAIVMLSGVFLAGCTLFGGDEEEAEDQNNNEIENVEVIEGDGEEAQLEEEPEEDESVDEEEEEVEEVEENEDNEESEEEGVEEEEAVETPEGAKTIGTASVAEGAAVSGYQYNVQGGQLVFEWKVTANGDAYPKAVAQQGSDNVLVVIFPSLRADYVADEEGSVDLGNLLPELSYRPTDAGSEYKFKYSSEKSFQLSTEDRGEEGRFVVIKIGM